MQRAGRWLATQARQELGAEASRVLNNHRPTQEQLMLMTNKDFALATAPAAVAATE